MIRGVMLIVFLLFVVDMRAQELSIADIYQKDGNTLTMFQYYPSDCIAGKVPLLFLRYVFPNGISNNSNQWIEWKMDFVDCQGVQYTQQFFAPLCTSPMQKANCLNFVPSESESFVFDSECIYPGTIRILKQFTGGPKDIVVSQKINFSPPLYDNPIKKGCPEVPFKLSLRGDKDIVVDWTVCGECTGLAIAYCNKMQGLNIFNVEDVPQPNSASQYIIQGLEYASDYDVKIISKCKLSSKPIETAVKTIKTKKLNCPVPFNLSLEKESGDSVYLAWDGAGNQFFSLKYWSKKDGEAYAKYLKNIKKNGAAIGNLHEGTTYIFQVAGENQFGTGNYSQPFELTTSDNIAPVIKNMKFDFFGASKVKVTWEAIVEPRYRTKVGKDLEFEYKIFLKENSYKKLIGSGRTKEYELIVDSLECDTTYVVSIISLAKSKYRSPKSDISIDTKPLISQVDFSCINPMKDPIEWCVFELSKEGVEKPVQNISFDENKTRHSMVLSMNRKIAGYLLYPKINGKLDKRYSVFVYHSKKLDNTITYYINISQSYNLKYQPIPYLLTLALPNGFKFSQREAIISNQSINWNVSAGLQLQDGGKYLGHAYYAVLSGDIHAYKFQLGIDSRGMLNYMNNSRSQQFASLFINPYLGMEIAQRKMTIPIKAERRLNVFSSFCFQSNKIIRPIYTFRLIGHLGYLKSTSHTVFNVYPTLTSSRNFQSTSQDFHSISIGGSLHLFSKYQLNYLQKKGERDSGRITSRVSDVAIRFSYYLPLNGQIAIENTLSQETVRKSLENNQWMSGYYLGMEHSYNIRRTNILITRGVGITQLPRYFDGYQNKKMRETLLSFKLAIGYTNNKIKSNDSK